MKIYKESRLEDDIEEYTRELDNELFWDKRTGPEAKCGRVADILMNVYGYMKRTHDSDGEEWFINTFLPAAVESGKRFGINGDYLDVVSKWIKSGMPSGKISKYIWNN